MKNLTTKQWYSVLNAMAWSYAASYAMMVDDAMIGFQKRSSKLGLLDCWDGLVFSFLFGKVKSNVTTLTPDDIHTLNDLFNKDRG